MSNYPFSPTPPGPFGPNPSAYGPDSSEALAPARRASVMLWILGGLGILCGVCITGTVWAVPTDELLKRFQQSLTAEQRNQLGNMDLVLVARVLITVVCALGIVLAGVMLGTAAFVRRGSRIAIGIAMGPCALLLLWCLLLLVVNVVAMAAGTAPVTGIVDVFIWAMIALASGITGLWLIQAFGAARRVSQQQLFAAQYWHHQQRQQQNTGYGYGAPPPPQSSATPQTWMTPPPPPPPAAPPATFAPPPPPPPAGGAGEGTNEPRM